MRRGVLLLLGILLAAVVLVYGEKKVRYDNYLHMKFEGALEDMLLFRNSVVELEEKYSLRFITARSFLLPPENVKSAGEICTFYNLTCITEAKNFQLILDWEENINNAARVKAPKVKADLTFFTAYRTFDEFNNFLSELQTQFPQLVTSVFSIGKSVQGRDINGISFTGLQNRGSPKPVILYNAGQHAREWVAPMSTAYVAFSLLSNYSSNADVTAMMDAFEWIIIPLVNPDGYNWTWTNDRMWRKNRRINAGSSCIGVDNNRNWAYMWLTGGSSTDPCSEVFAGPSAFSEPEEVHLANYITANGRVQGYIDFHAAGYLFLNPYGYTRNLPPANADQQALAEDFVVAVYRVHGKSYVFGNIMNVLYQASGNSVDWAYVVGNVYYSFTIELREGPTNVFILPPEQIIPQGQEVMAGVLAMANYMLENPPSKV